MRARCVATLGASLVLVAPARAQDDSLVSEPEIADAALETPAANPEPAAQRPSRYDLRWSAMVKPAPGAPRVIGGYADGCVQGATALPSKGPGYQVFRVHRRRHFGHPDLIRYVKRLGASAKKKRLGTLLVGDLAQPRGGPTPTGHRSHQSGLDVDIWFSPADRVRIPRDGKDGPHPPAVVDLRTRKLLPSWERRLERLLQTAANDPTVDRIFVHAAIKRRLCTKFGEAPWLARVRPWHGHHDHFHVRLRCPPGSTDCREQKPIPPGTGCDSLAWWFQERRPAPAKPSVPRPAPPPRPPIALPSPPPGLPPRLIPTPSACQALLEAPAQMARTSQARKTARAR